MPTSRGRSRKAKRKPRKEQPQIDDDLRELAVALAQYEIDEGADGWLKMPWRSGWNAAWFAFESGRMTENWVTSLAEIGTLISRPTMRLPNDYWMLQDRIESERGLARAAARCAQVMIASRSEGDGSIFNAILQQPVNWAMRITQPYQSNIIADLMERARCMDAIGVEGPSVKNDINDHLRRAFQIAWRRRLYAAAYALPPAIKS